MEIGIIIAVVVVALVFDYTNGFHDAANAIATSVSTGALTPRVALAMAAVMNFVGAFLGQKVAQTVSDTIDPGTGSHGLVIVMAGLIGAITWNMLTWLLGLPSSSSHALFGGLIGATLVGASTSAIDFGVVLSKVVLPALIAPKKTVRKTESPRARTHSGSATCAETLRLESTAIQEAPASRLTAAAA